jgi:Na+-transporting methylmalonyl-CoA/oxaloacetate decarboxylase beta subunit
MFPIKVRLSGMAIGTQIGFAIGGFAPTAAAAIAGGGSAGWVPVAAYVLAFSVLAAIAIATARETAHVPMAQLDQRQAVTAARLVTTQRRPARASGPSRQNVPNRS